MKKFYTLILFATLLSGVGSNAAEKVLSPGQSGETFAKTKLTLNSQLKSEMAARQLPRKVASDESPITSLPEGAEEKLFVASGTGYYYIWGEIFPNEYEGMAARLAFGPNDEVYIYNPFSSFLTETWLKGKMVDGEIKIELPQLIYREDYGDGLVSDFYAVRMIHQSTGEGDGTFIPDPDSQEISYFPDGEAYIMDLDDLGETILGMAWLDPSVDELIWNGNGDYGVNYEPFEYSLVTPPSNLETEEWAFSNSWGEGHFANVGFDGNDVYVQGFSSYFPEAWIKGEIVDGDVVFPSPQYIGIDEVVGVYDFFCSTTGHVDKDWETGYETPFLEMADKAVFTYDVNEKKMSSENVLLVNSGWEYVYYMEMYVDPELKYQPEEISLIPATPFITDFTPYNPDFRSGSVECYVPVLNDDRFILNPENLYFRLYIDGELYQFQPDDYFALDEPMTDIPVDFDTFNFYIFGCLHTITLYIDGIESIGVQSVYKDAGIEYLTPISYYGTTGIKYAEKENVSETTYYNTQGQKVSAETRGLVIKVVKYSDGRTISQKELKR